MKINDIRPRGVMKSARLAYLQDVKLYLDNLDRFYVRNCPGCGNASSNFFCEKDGFAFSRCPSCWTVFMNPGPTQDLVSELYRTSNTYKFWGEYVYPSSAEARFLKLTVPRSEYIISAFDNEKLQGLKFLELGAGTGDVIRHLSMSFSEIEPFALEPNPAMWAYFTENRVKLIKSDLESLDSTGTNFDCVFAFEVLEHLLEPRLLFEKASLLLCKGGKLILSTPNAASLEVNIMRDDSNTLDMEHISLITPAAVHHLAITNGLRVLKIETPGKFDLELMKKKYRRSILKFLFRKRVGHETIQIAIAQFGLSSHMKVVLEKI
jgi:2-polyprenyl-3-methyl-5-hydroxy-6-metoxy-1,4-benzoquinol methylase